MQDVSKCFFVTAEYQEYAKEPKDLCEDLMKKWCTEEGHTGAWAYCLKNFVGHYPVFDDAGNFLGYRLATTKEERKKVPKGFCHVHMVLKSTRPVHSSLIEKIYGSAMYLNVVRGDPKCAKSYINKTHAFDESAKEIAGLPYERVLYIASRGL